MSVWGKRDGHRGDGKRQLENKKWEEDPKTRGRGGLGRGPGFFAKNSATETDARFMGRVKGVRWGR